MAEHKQNRPSKFKAWVEAMRLRTIPVSIAGVIGAYGYAILAQSFRWPQAVLCALFAILAQIASNFANEYFDFKAGLDKPGRVGPRRGVTEGDIKPHQMKFAAYLTLGIAAVIGCSLIYWGGWWLLAAGIVIVLGALAYSTGPYPLSRHGLGEIAVIVFFGIAPVNLTFYVMTGVFDWTVFWGSVAFGLLGANVLVVNNYRDIYDDAEVGKRTLAVMLGRRFTGTLYLLNGLAAVALMWPLWGALIQTWWIALPLIYLIYHISLWHKLTTRQGPALNPILGATARNMLLYSIAFLITCIFFFDSVPQEMFYIRHLIGKEFQTVNLITFP